MTTVNPRKSAQGLAIRIVRGYVRTGRRLAVVFAVSVGIVAVSAALVFPLWYLAVNYRITYAVSVGLAGAGFLAYRLVKKAEDHRDQGSSLVSTLGAIIGRTLLRTIGLLAAVTALYGVIVAFSAGLYAVAVPATAAYLMIFGYIVYGKSRNTGKP